MFAENKFLDSGAGQQKNSLLVWLFYTLQCENHLGIPNTRALSLILTGESVLRDMFYDGNPFLLQSIDTYMTILFRQLAEFNFRLLR